MPCEYSVWKFPEANRRQDKLVTLGRQKDCLQQHDLCVLAFPYFFSFNIYLGAVVITRWNMKCFDNSLGFLV